MLFEYFSRRLAAAKMIPLQQGWSSAVWSRPLMVSAVSWSTVLAKRGVPSLGAVSGKFIDPIS